MFVGAVAMNGLIYVFGGNINSEIVSNTFEVYSPQTNEWETSNLCMKEKGCNMDVMVIEKSCMLFKKVIKAFRNPFTH